MKVITNGTWHVGTPDKPKTIDAGETVDHKELGITDDDVDRYVALGTLVKPEAKAKTKTDPEG